MTPASVHVREATASAVPGAGTSGRPDRVGAGSSTAPKRQHRVLEFLEDAVLLLLIVAAVPAVMMLLALPIAVLFRIVAEIGRRW
jgi:hypothetical protein